MTYIFGHTVVSTRDGDERLPPRDIDGSSIVYFLGHTVVATRDGDERLPPRGTDG